MNTRIFLPAYFNATRSRWYYKSPKLDKLAEEGNKFLVFSIHTLGQRKLDKISSKNEEEN